MNRFTSFCRKHFLLTSLLCVVLAHTVYVGTGIAVRRYELKHWLSLKAQQTYKGSEKYEPGNIESIRVGYSYLNMILSYETWYMIVSYHNEQETCMYRWEDGRIRIDSCFKNRN